MADSKKCAHITCSCMTTEKYCSAACESAAGTIDITCNCGHPGCRGEVAQP